MVETLFVVRENFDNLLFFWHFFHFLLGDYQSSNSGRFSSPVIGVLIILIFSLILFYLNILLLFEFYIVYFLKELLVYYFILLLWVFNILYPVISSVYLMMFPVLFLLLILATLPFNLVVMHMRDLQFFMVLVLSFSKAYGFKVLKQYHKLSLSLFTSRCIHLIECITGYMTSFIG